jgi:hypothetical protein
VLTDNFLNRHICPPHSADNCADLFAADRLFQISLLEDTPGIRIYMTDITELKRVDQMKCDFLNIVTLAEEKTIVIELRNRPSDAFPLCGHL